MVKSKHKVAAPYLQRFVRIVITGNHWDDDEVMYQEIRAREQLIYGILYASGLERTGAQEMREILQHRLGLSESYAGLKTPQEVAEIMKLPVEKIRRMERKALDMVFRTLGMGTGSWWPKLS